MSPTGRLASPSSRAAEMHPTTLQLRGWGGTSLRTNPPLMEQDVPYFRTCCRKLQRPPNLSRGGMQQLMVFIYDMIFSFLFRGRTCWYTTDADSLREVNLLASDHCQPDNAETATECRGILQPRHYESMQLARMLISYNDGQVPICYQIHLLLQKLSLQP